MHVRRIEILSKGFPAPDRYPFNQDLLRQTSEIDLVSPVTLFVGENGTGKSTLLQAVCRRCGIHIWAPPERARIENNPLEKLLYRYIEIEWRDGPVPGAFFSSDTFNYFARSVDDWSASDPHLIGYFGGKSFLTQSHGQSLLSYFRSRYAIPGLYLLDEPETALSPRSQIDLVRILRDMGAAGHAQFIVATHSPILMACPGATIYSFDSAPIRPIACEETEHYRAYKEFFENRERLLGADSASSQEPSGP
ncbi:AAA family ATPase [Candidatus Sumerlaeota bacterium]|nr:AAA family ATPase [Candidatus Sumerlaeota bacterium]